MPTPLLKYIFLSNEREKNERSFWRFLFTYPPIKTMPVLYTPTVGEACMKWATHRQSYRGIYITPEDKGHMKEILRNFPRQDIRCIVVTDGGRILGLGDLGASGLGIPVGKLILYTLIGTVPPQYTLPVQLDVGTNRKEIIEDPLYHGWHHARLSYEEELPVVEEFVDAVKEVFGPTCLVQFEDFQMETAFRLLDHFRWRCNCFNDDIEGTASVTAAAIYSATRIPGVPALKDQKIIFIGAGSAAIGIATLLVSMAVAHGGITKKEMERNILMFDAKGLVRAGRTDLIEGNKPFMHKMEPIASVFEGVKKHKATTIVGVSGCPRLITKEIVQEMCKHCEHPLIFPLSNPTTKAECTAEQAYQWSDEKCIFASGSPFPDYKRKNGQFFVPSQSNNSWIFPAVGFALVTTRARHCPGEVFAVAAEALATLVSQSDYDMGAVLPHMNRIRELSLPISIEVAKYLYKKELATVKIPQGKTLQQWFKEEQFNPATYDETY